MRRLDSFEPFFYENGDVYYGEMSENKKSGFGKLLLSNGEIFEGNFEEDKMSGKGR